MPIPTPRKGESQNNFISRCISAVKKSDPDRPNKQVQAICFSKWRGEEVGEIIKENVSVKYLMPVEIKESIEGAARIFGTAITATTSRNGITYTVEGLKDNDSLDGKNISVGHGDSPADNVAVINNTEWDGNGRNYYAQLFNTARYPDAIEMVKNKLMQFVSIEAVVPKLIKKEGKVIAQNPEFLGLAFVKNPGVREASAALQGESFGFALEEAFTTKNIISEENIMEEKEQPKEEVVEKKEEVAEQVVYKTDPKVLEMIQKLTDEIKSLKEQAEEETKEEETETKEEEKTEEPEKEEESKAIVKEEDVKPESNLILEGQTRASFWVIPEGREWKEAT